MISTEFFFRKESHLGLTFRNSNSIRFSLYAIQIANRIMWSVRYSDKRKNANIGKFKIPYKLPFLFKRNSYIEKKYYSLT